MSKLIDELQHMVDNYRDSKINIMTIDMLEYTINRDDLQEDAPPRTDGYITWHEGFTQSHS